MRVNRHALMRALRMTADHYRVEAMMKRSHHRGEGVAAVRRRAREANRCDVLAGEARYIAQQLRRAKRIELEG